VNNYCPFVVVVDKPQILSIHSFIFKLLSTIYRTYIAQNTLRQLLVFPPCAVGAEYCDERVCVFCLSVRLHICLSVLGPIFGTPRPIFIKFLELLIGGLPIAAVAI